mgnify:CR=1 FL=1
MKKNYNKSIKLQCATCGADCFFETDEQTGVITCAKCNRVYYGGYDELVNLNQKRIEDEVELTKEEVMKDLNKEIMDVFKKNGFKVR